MSNYQFLVFSEKEDNCTGIKNEGIITESNQSSPLRQEYDDVDSSSSSSPSSSSSSSSSSSLLSLLSPSTSPSTSISTSLSSLPSSSSLSSSSSSLSSSSSSSSSSLSSSLSSSSSSSSSSSNGRTSNCELKKKRICIKSRQSRKRDAPSNVVVHSSLEQPPLPSSSQQQKRPFDDASVPHLNGKYANNGAPGKAKIPRPANAFMLFANEWRKKLAVENPRESNKDISVRLGVLWKNMAQDAKGKYFALAREVDAEHKRKYPDYVYNPKEARLRKAMREQSRELSRQSILQTAVVSTIASGATNACNTNNGVTRSGQGSGRAGVNESTNYLNHPMTLASLAPPAAAVSSIPGDPTCNASRIVNSWFPNGHTPSTSDMKPMLSHRVMQSQQLRTFDKTKEVVKERSECAGDFITASGTITTCYPSDFGVHETLTQPKTDTNTGSIGSNDYCDTGEFADGQKWHPYQSTATPYHIRCGPMSKMASRHGIQNINLHNNGPWNQFSSVPLFSMTPQNPMIREPRHMVLLQNQQERHCSIAADKTPIVYMPNKVDIGHRLQPGHSQSNYQETKKDIEDAPRWEVPTYVFSSHSSTMNDHVSTAQCEPEFRIKEQQPKQEQTKEYNDTEIADHQRQSVKSPCKQPLPGFHQAFGSTEIGKFSRTKFFANMVNESGGVGGQMIPDGYLPVSMFPFPTSSDRLRGNITISHNSYPTAQEILVPKDCYWIAPNIAIPIANIADPNYVAFMDLSHRLNRDWMHTSPILPRDYSPAINNCPILVTPELFPSLHEKKKTEFSNIDNVTYSLRNNDRKNENAYRVDTNGTHIEGNIQEDDCDNNDILINVDDIDS